MLAHALDRGSEPDDAIVMAMQAADVAPVLRGYLPTEMLAESDGPIVPLQKAALTVRIDELLANGSRLLQEARDERASHARTRWLLEQATTRGVQLEAALRRMDPVWRETCES